MKLTDWYPARVNPVRPGVYECLWCSDDSFREGVWFNRFDGQFWHWGSLLASRAAERVSPINSHASLKSWRGVTRASE